MCQLMLPVFCGHTELKLIDYLSYNSHGMKPPPLILFVFLILRFECVFFPFLKVTLRGAIFLWKLDGWILHFRAVVLACVSFSEL